MKVRLLNAAVMPAPGTYTLAPLTAAQFSEAMYRASLNDRLISYIGYEQTAAHLERLAGVAVPVSRAATVPEDGDTLLICRLRYRVADPATKGAPVPEEYEYFTCSYGAPQED